METLRNMMQSWTWRQRRDSEWNYGLWREGGGVPCGGREMVEEQVMVEKQVMVELQCSGDIRDGRYARARD